MDNTVYLRSSEKKNNIMTPYMFLTLSGKEKEFSELLFEKNDIQSIRGEFQDLFERIPQEQDRIVFTVVNDASVASRRYQETYFCHTPLCYAYEDLLRLFEEKTPKVRHRNASKTFYEPLVPMVCAKNMILNALINSVSSNEGKTIELALTSKSLRISYSFDPNKIDDRLIQIRRKYFDLCGAHIKETEDDYLQYVKQHRTIMRSSFSDGMKTIEVLYNVRATTFKKYMVVSDEHGLLTKSEYDIYNAIKNRGGSTLKLLADEFGYNSTRATKYHVDKLIKLDLVHRVGPNKSHNCFYKAT